MYIRKIEIKNVKSIDSFEWELKDKEQLAGWHVILGDNGAGKSTLLRACAVGLLGPKNAFALRQPWTEWITSGQTEGRISLTISQDPQYDAWQKTGNTSSGDLKFTVKINNEGLSHIEKSPSPNRHVWGGRGWFCASFGPYRRFSGGSQEYEKLFYAAPKLARHLSIFGEDVALSETLTWLKHLHYEHLEPIPFGHWFAKQQVRMLNAA